MVGWRQFLSQFDQSKPPTATSSPRDAGPTHGERHADIADQASPRAPVVSDATTERRGDSGPPARVRPPVAFRDGDQERCSEALSRFEHSYGRESDRVIRSALLGIAQAGGWQGQEWALDELGAGRDVTDQAWRWLAMVAEITGGSDPALAARVGFFFRVFSRDIGPNLRIADQLDIGLEQPPAGVCAAALSHAINALDEVDAETVVLRYPGGQFDARGMQFLLADALVKMPDGGGVAESAARSTARALIPAS
jgi:hypothetical protein